MVWVNRLLLAFNALLLSALLFLIHLHGSGVLVPGAWEYKDLISILLTTVTIVLAFLALIVGGAAIWGYQSIKSIAETKAENVSKDTQQTYIKSEDFRTSIDLAIKERVDALAKDAVQDALAPSILRSDEAPEFQSDDKKADGNGMPDGRRENKNRGDELWQD